MSTIVILNSESSIMARGFLVKLGNLSPSWDWVPWIWVWYYLAQINPISYLLHFVGEHDIHSCPKSKLRW